MSNIETCIRCGKEYHYEARHLCEDLARRGYVGVDFAGLTLPESSAVTVAVPLGYREVEALREPPKPKASRLPLLAAMMGIACMGGFSIEDMSVAMPPRRQHSRNSMKHDRAGGWTPKHPRNQKGRKR